MTIRSHRSQKWIEISCHLDLLNFPKYFSLPATETLPLGVPSSLASERLFSSDHGFDTVVHILN
jgi:hypothetical protein